MKIRLLLFLVAAIWGFTFWQVMEIFTDLKLQIFFGSLCAIGVTSTAIMFVFSFVDITPLPNGSFCYNPNNPYWRLMKWFYRENWKSRNKICKGHWMLYFFIVVCICAAILFFSLIYCMGVGVWFLLFDPRVAGGKNLIIVVSAVMLILLILRYEWFQKMFLVLFLALGLCLIVAVLITNFTKALVMAGIIIGYIVAAIFIVWTLYNVLPSLKQSWLGMIISKKLCPELVACPLEAKSK